MGKVECIHGFEVSECSLRLLEEKLNTEIESKKIKFDLMDIGNPDHVVINDVTEGKYDIIVHMNCFYFWDNLSLCGQRLIKLLNEEGHVIGGFYWGCLPKNNKRVFKNVHLSNYMEMLRDSQGFDMDSAAIVDLADGMQQFE